VPVSPADKRLGGAGGPQDGTGLTIATGIRPPLAGVGPEENTLGNLLAMETGAEPMGWPATSVIERFPKHELTIERLVRTSETFRSMCEDYTVGVEALRRWDRTTDPTAPKHAVRIAELRESLAELEGEMLEMLEQG
jgi:hypothetical protein